MTIFSTAVSNALPVAHNPSPEKKIVGSPNSSMQTLAASVDASRAVASHLPSSMASNVGAATAGSAGRPEGPEPIRRCLSMIMFVRANFQTLDNLAASLAMRKDTHTSVVYSMCAYTIA